MQGMRCNDITSVALRLIPTPLLHFLSLSKLEHVCKNHYELFLLQHPQSELHQDLYPQLSLHQIPTNAGLRFLIEVHPTFLDNQT